MWWSIFLLKSDVFLSDKFLKKPEVTHNATQIECEIKFQNLGNGQQNRLKFKISKIHIQEFILYTRVSIISA